MVEENVVEVDLLEIVKNTPPEKVTEARNTFVGILTSLLEQNNGVSDGSTE